MSTDFIDSLETCLVTIFVDANTCNNNNNNKWEMMEERGMADDGKKKLVE